MSIRDAIRKKKNKSPLSNELLSSPLFKAMEASLDAKLDEAVKQVREEQVERFEIALTAITKEFQQTITELENRLGNAVETSATELNSHAKTLGTQLDEKANQHTEKLGEESDGLLKWCKEQIASLFAETSDRLDKIVANIESMRGPKGDKGDKGDNGSSDTGIEIANKLNTTKETVQISVIAGLGKRLDQILAVAKAKRGGGGTGGGGGMPNWYDKAFTGDGSTTQFTLDYKVGGGGSAIITLLNGQVQELTTHYAVNNSSGKAVVTFTTAPFEDDAIYMQYARA